MSPARLLRVQKVFRGDLSRSFVDFGDAVKIVFERRKRFLSVRVSHGREVPFVGFAWILSAVPGERVMR